MPAFETPDYTWGCSTPVSWIKVYAEVGHIRECFHSHECFQMSEILAYKWGEVRAKSELYAHGKPFGPDNKHALGGHNCLTWSFHSTGVSEAPSLVFLALIPRHVSVLGIYLRALHPARWPTAQGSLISKGLRICPDPHMLTTLPLPTLPTSQRMDPFCWKPFDQCSISLITGHSQIKAIMWCHFRPIRRVTITLKKQKTSVDEDVGKIQDFMYYWWQCKIVQLLWKQLRQVLKKLNTITMSSENFIPLYERIESIQISKRYLYTRIHSSIIHIIQKVEPIQMLVNRYTNKMCYRHTTEYYSAFKGGNPDTCYYMGKRWGR